MGLVVVLGHAEKKADDHRESSLQGSTVSRCHGDIDIAIRGLGDNTMDGVSHQTAISCDKTGTHGICLNNNMAIVGVRRDSRNHLLVHSSIERKEARNPIESFGFLFCLDTLPIVIEAARMCETWMDR